MLVHGVHIIMDIFSLIFFLICKEVHGVHKDEIMGVLFWCNILYWSVKYVHSLSEYCISQATMRRLLTYLIQSKHAFWPKLCFSFLLSRANLNSLAIKFSFSFVNQLNINIPTLKSELTNGRRNSKTDVHLTCSPPNHARWSKRKQSSLTLF
jgi:hypothetical protein